MTVKDTLTTPTLQSTYYHERWLAIKDTLTTPSLQSTYYHERWLAIKDTLTAHGSKWIVGMVQLMYP
jgi:hypothetical protein